MTDGNTLTAAISLAVLDSEQGHRILLNSVVLTAQAIFDAAASSIILRDTDTGELVFERGGPRPARGGGARTGRPGRRAS